MIRKIKHYAENARPIRAYIELFHLCKISREEQKQLQAENYRSRPVVAWHWGWSWGWEAITLLDVFGHLETLV